MLISSFHQKSGIGFLFSDFSQSLGGSSR
ncbi:MAG: hypothetical protein UT66_C0040G0001, partial [candidate division CPR2 bacterium GW2011_GWC1_39_9]